MNTENNENSNDGTAKIKVTLLNQGDSGLSNEIEVDADQRMDDFLFARLGEEASLANYSIRLNGRTAQRTDIIEANAVITIAPLNQKGA